MLITRISGCKGTTFLLFYKELRNYLLISRSHFSSSPVHWRL